MKILAGFIFTFLLGAMFFSLFHVSAGMDMAGGMMDCPFMSQEDVLCRMDLADHLEAWKSAFLAVVPNILILFLVVGVAAFWASFPPNLLILKPPIRQLVLYKQLQERTYTFSYRPLQEFFASGVLHPKLF